VRDYVYFPLGGSKRTEPRVVFNLITTMVIIGLWHGASVLWLLYGLAQGIAMALERWFERLRGGKQFATTPLKKLLSWAMTFSFVSFTLLAVRGVSFESVGAVLTEFGENSDLPIWAWLALAACVVTHFQPEDFYQRLKDRIVALPTVVHGLAMGLVIGTMIFVMSRSSAFIYFQF